MAKQLKWGLGKEYEITIISEADEARPLLAFDAFPVVNLDFGLPPYTDTPQQGFKLPEETHKLQRGQRTLSPAAIAALTAYAWPGNVRDLQNRICRTLALTGNNSRHTARYQPTHPA